MNHTQRSFFDDELRADLAKKRGPSDPNIDPRDVKRVSGQNYQILQMLMSGPKTNQQLAQVSLKYTSRISDLRAAGYSISCERGSHGVTLYTLH